MNDHDRRHDWARNGIEEVSPTIHRIPVQLPGDVLEAVNVYLVEGPDGVGLIDSGWLRPESIDELKRALAELGWTFADLTVVLATHYHADHYTLALELRRRTGVEVYLGAGEQFSIEVLRSEGLGTPAFARRMERAGIPASFVAQHLRSNPAAHLYEFPDHWIEDADAAGIGGRPLEVVATPGHTRGHVSFADKAAGVFFAGDHVLPHITPSIGFEAVSSNLPLADYLDSLTKVCRRPDAVLLPAHGPVMPSVHRRAEELLAHHEDRLNRCLAAVDGGARTGYEVAMRVPWTRRERQLGELAPLDQIMAVHETVAHLAVLDRDERIVTLREGPVDEYAIV